MGDLIHIELVDQAGHESVVRSSAEPDSWEIVGRGTVYLQPASWDSQELTKDARLYPQRSGGPAFPIPFDGTDSETRSTAVAEALEILS